MSSIFTILHVAFYTVIYQESGSFWIPAISSSACNSSIYARTSMYIRLLSVWAWHRRSCPSSCSSCYNGYLVTWKVVCLIAGLRIFRCGDYLRFHTFIWPLLVSITISLCNHEDTILWKPHASRGPVCNFEICQWCGDSCFASSAISKDRYLPQIPRRSKHKSLRS
jgi:hypothetical protein